MKTQLLHVVLVMALCCCQDSTRPNASDTEASGIRQPRTRPPVAIKNVTSVIDADLFSNDIAPPDTKYFLAQHDLNADGLEEKIVYVTGSSICGSGGCQLYLLTPYRNSFHIIGNVSIARPPIRLLNSYSHGWRDLSVHVSGGGIHPGFDAHLKYDGKGYPANPSLLSPVASDALAETVIGDTR